MTDADRLLGLRIRQGRFAAGLTQTALAEAVGVTFQQIQKYESGKNRVAATRLLAIAAALGKPVEYFYEPIREGSAPETGRVDDRRAFRTAKLIGDIPSEAVRHQLLKMVESLSRAGPAKGAE